MRCPTRASLRASTLSVLARAPQARAKSRACFGLMQTTGSLWSVQRVEHVTLKPAACFKQHQGGVFAKPHHFMEPRLVVAQQGDLVAATAGQVKGVFANIGSYQRLTQGTVLWVGWEPSDGPRLSTCGGVVPPNCSGLLSKGTQAGRTNATRRSFPTQRHTIYQACSHPDSSAVCTYKRHWVGAEAGESETWDVVGSEPRGRCSLLQLVGSAFRRPLRKVDSLARLHVRGRTHRWGWCCLEV